MDFKWLLMDFGKIWWILKGYLSDFKWIFDGYSWVLTDNFFLDAIIFFGSFSTLSFCGKLIHGYSWDKAMDMVGIYSGRDEMKRNSGNKLTGIIGYGYIYTHVCNYQNLICLCIYIYMQIDSILGDIDIEYGWM